MQGNIDEKIKGRKQRLKEMQGCGCVISVLSLIALPIMFFIDKNTLPIVGILIGAGIVILIAASIFRSIAYD